MAAMPLPSFAALVKTRPMCTFFARRQCLNTRAVSVTTYLRQPNLRLYQAAESTNTILLLAEFLASGGTLNPTHGASRRHQRLRQY